MIRGKSGYVHYRQAPTTFPVFNANISFDNTDWWTNCFFILGMYALVQIPQTKLILDD